MTIHRFCFAALLISVAVATRGAEETAAREIHRRAITSSSDVLFAAESKVPGNDADWKALQRNARILTKASQELASIRQLRSELGWQKLAAELSNAARAAVRAAESRNLDALVAANGTIVAICEACHDDYRDAGHGMTSDNKSGK